MNDKIIEYFNKYGNEYYLYVENFYEYYLSPLAKQYCGHYLALRKPLHTNNYEIYHTNYKSLQRFETIKLKKIMIPTKEDLIKTYKEFPENRNLLISLFGTFIDDATKEIIEKEEKIKFLEKELEKCKNNER